MTVHFYPPTGQFLYSEHLVPAGGAKGASITQDLGGTYYDMYSGDLVLANMLVPKLGKTVFPEASLDLNFARNLSLVDDVSGQNLVDFSRASGGTYVDSQGVIRNATTNLLIWSEDPSQWPSPLQAGATLTPNTAIAPNGTLTADTLTLSVNSFYYGRPSYTQAGSYIVSIFIRADSPQTIGLRIANSSGSESAFITCSVTTNWQRFSAAINFTSNPTVVNVGLETRALGGGTGSAATVYIWGAQLEQSSTVGEYIPTGATINSAPRFDHNPSTGESLGLLVEESRTNLLLRSEEFDNASWTKVNGTITGNTAASPDSNATADLLAGNASTTYCALRQTLSFTVSVTYTISCYVKAAGFADFRIIFSSAAFGTNITTTFNLASGAITFNQALSAEIRPLGNGWYRCSATATATATSSTFAQLQTTGNGDGASGIYLWGAQLEAGAFPTSYVKTEAATATRAADVVSITGTNFSSWYRQDEGTVFAETNVLATAPGTNRIIQLAGATTADRQDLFFSGGTLTAFVNVGGIAQVNAVTSNSISANQNARSGYAYKQNDFSWTLNVGPIKTDDSGTLPAVDKAGIGVRLDAAGSLNGTIKRLAFWPQRLPDTTLQSITR